MPRTRKKQPVTRERIIEAAIEVADEVGLAGLSLRGVAARLNVTPMALYNHIADKSELEDVVVAHILEQMLHPVKITARTPWQKILRDIAGELKRALAEHPMVLQVFTRFPLHQSCIALAEQAHQAFLRAGMPIEDCALAFKLFADFISGSVLVEHQFSVEHRTDDLEKTLFSSAYATQFPETVRAAQALGRARKPHFDLAIDLFIGMIERYAADAKD